MQDYSNVRLLEAGYHELVPFELIVAIVPLGKSFLDSSQMQWNVLILVVCGKCTFVIGVCTERGGAFMALEQ